MGRIAVLSDELINQIAAGEVVERPASVIKELCENSLDAGATSVRVALSGAGLSVIGVADDGGGMSREDARAALGRHATSKLRDLDGLAQIATMGFRGEALPAIASVSRFQLTTSEAGAAAGTRVASEGGGEAQVTDAAPEVGTRVEVADLFFNTPARRKFMRRDQTELSHCHEAVVRLALSHPEVGFFLTHEGKSLLAAPPAGASLRERIGAVLGADVHAHLLAVDERRLGVAVTGYVASPELTFPTARGLYTFVNRRFIRDRGLNHAIARAFRDTLPPGRQPVAVLFVELDPRAVDVNVHPQKLEVRFADARSVHDATVAAVDRALKAAPWLKPDGSGVPGEAVPGAHYAQAVEQFLARARTPWLGEPPGPAASWPAQTGGRPGFGTERPGLNEAPPPGYYSALRLLGGLGGRFWVCEGAGGSLVVVDPHAAVERVRFDELRRAMTGAAPAGQQSLFTASVELPPAEVALLAANAEALERLGVGLEPFGEGTVAVRALPGALAGCEPARVVRAVGEALCGGAGAGEAPLEAVARALACEAAALAPRDPGAAGCSALFAALDRADFGVRCVHGQVVVAELTLLELDRRATSGRRPEN